MKKFFFLLVLASHMTAFAENNCDIRRGESLGVKVMEFASGKTVHSKMAIKDVTPDAIFEEMIELQHMEICNEKIFSKKCVLKLKRDKKFNRIILLRDQQLLMNWSIHSKKKAEDFVRSLVRMGFCF